MIHASDKVRPKEIGKYLALLAIVFLSYFLAGKLGQVTTSYQERQYRAGLACVRGGAGGSFTLWISRLARDLSRGISG